MYEATIYYDATEDSYEDGEIGYSSSSWTDTIHKQTLEELKEAIEYATYNTFDNGNIEHDDMNEYEDASEYHTSYLTTVDNDGEASTAEVAKWRRGEMTLYAVNCHILISKVTKSKALIPVKQVQGA